MSAPRTPSGDRLGRLLNLVPYLLARPGILISEAATDLGVTGKQLREDLELLWVCGLPGYGPGDLIDMAIDGDHVTISHDAGMDKPLRLNPDEALALVVALRMLAETPGIGTRDAIERALAKIENAAGDLAGAPVAVRLPANQKRLAAVRAAVESGHALRLTYYTPSRDESSDRVVDPMRMLMVGGFNYLEAWCRRAEAVRLFRIDRIDAFTELDQASEPPAAAVPHDVTGGVFRPGPELPLVTLRVGRGGRWITEYYPVEHVDRAGAEWLVSMRVTDLGWAQRFLTGQARDVTVVGPPELLERIRDQAATALGQYAAPPGLAAATPAPRWGYRVLMWVWIAVVAIALVVLSAVAMKVLGRLRVLERAARRLQHRQQEALAMQAGAERLQVTLEALQQRAELAQDQMEAIKAGRGR